MNRLTGVQQRLAILGMTSLAALAVLAMPFGGRAQDATPAMSEAELLQEGEQIYSSVCTACHQPGGEGVPGIFLPLDGNPLITSDDPTYVISTVLTGRGGMPRFADIYSDEEVAAVVTYIRQEWSNNASPVTAEQVAEVRRAVDATPAATPRGQLPGADMGEGAEVASPQATPGS